MAGAPTGNQNAAKGKRWKHALEKVTGRNDWKKLDEIAEKLVESALEGDMAAIKEIGDRLDGKAVQSIAGEPDAPLIIRLDAEDGEL